MGFLALRKLFNKLRFENTDNGPYRFLVRNWSGINDLNLLSQVLSTETWRANLRPQELCLDDFNSIMVLAPHQDDELIGAGGLLLKAKQEKIKTSIVFLTNGAQTGLRLDGKKITQDETVNLRKQEALSVCKALDAQYEELGIDNVSMKIAVEHVTRLEKLISKHQPELIVLPWMFDGSPKHRVSSQILYHALQSNRLTVREIWGYQVNNTPFANGYIDISSNIEEKLQLLEMYYSQNHGIRSYRNLAQGLSAWNSRFMPSKQNKADASYAEIFHALPVDEFCQLVKQYYFNNFEQTYLGKKNIYRTMSNLYREQQ